MLGKKLSLFSSGRIVGGRVLALSGRNGYMYTGAPQQKAGGKPPHSEEGVAYKASAICETDWLLHTLASKILLLSSVGSGYPDTSNYCIT